MSRVDTGGGGQGSDTSKRAFVIFLVSLGDAIVRTVLFHMLLIWGRASLKGMTEGVRERARVKIRMERAKSNKLNLPKPLVPMLRVIPK